MGVACIMLTFGSKVTSSVNAAGRPAITGCTGTVMVIATCRPLAQGYAQAGQPAGCALHTGKGNTSRTHKLTQGCLPEGGSA